MNKKKLIIFDLDGVLINSKPNMKKSLDLTSRKLKIELKFKNQSTLLLTTPKYIIQSLY